MGLILKRVCRGCQGLFPNDGSLFTHGYCRKCWPKRRSWLEQKGLLKCGHLPPPKAPSEAEYFNAMSGRG